LPRKSETVVALGIGLLDSKAKMGQFSGTPLLLAAAGLLYISFPEKKPSEFSAIDKGCDDAHQSQ
jgi:hypothetical protein